MLRVYLGSGQLLPDHLHTRRQSRHLREFERGGPSKFEEDFGFAAFMNVDGGCPALAYPYAWHLVDYLGDTGMRFTIDAALIGYGGDGEFPRLLRQASEVCCRCGGLTLLAMEGVEDVERW